jgi:hypothetical protein
MPTYSPHPDVVSTQIDEGESVLLSLETQQYYSLNETGSRIWDLLSEGHDAKTIALEITKEWDATPDEALEHVRSFLQELNDEGLVVTDREAS